MGGVWSYDGSRVLFSMTLEGEQFDVFTAAPGWADGRRGLIAIKSSVAISGCRASGSGFSSLPRRYGESA